MMHTDSPLGGAWTVATRSGAAVIAAIATWGLSGCLAPAVVATAGVTVAQAGTSAYFGGQLVTAYEAPLEMVEYAARKAVVVLQFDPRVDRRGDNSLYLMARGLDGREVSIRVESASPAVTRLKIRVGVWGDQAVSRIIQRQVEEELSLAGIAP